MEPRTILMILMGLLSMGAVIAVIMMPTSKDKANKRAAALGARKGLRAGPTSTNNPEAPKDRRKQVQESLAKIEEKNKAQAKKAKIPLSQWLEQAGLTITPRDFYLLSAILAIIMGGVGLISGQDIKVTLGMVVIGGLGMPRWIVGFLRKRRQKKFVNEFSNSIDVIVRGVKSGLPVNECLKIISRDAQEPVRTEFYLMTEGIRIGLSLEQSLERMYDRMPLPEVNFFSIVLIIQKTTGGNLAEALGNLGTVLRNRKLMEGKIAALSMEAKASAVILGSLPFMVGGLVQASSPGYLQPLVETQIGNLILLAGFIWMSIGIFVMKNMISIKV